MVNYVPSKGDIIWIDFDPQLGKEIKKCRPSLVVSPQWYNRDAGLLLCVPITTTIKKYPFVVTTILEGKNAAVLCDQVKSFDWKMRKAELMSRASLKLIDDVMGKINAILIDE